MERTQAHLSDRSGVFATISFLNGVLYGQKVRNSTEINTVLT